jgi:Glucose / Sorbosone dehydrogenase
LNTINIRLRPVVSGINLPTVLKTTLLPGDPSERLFIATQLGEILYTYNGGVETFLDIRSRVIQLGSNGGYDERGLVGMAFHPNFYYNGLFYLHYTKAGSQGPGVSPYSATTGETLDSFTIDPCDARTLNFKWINRETEYDHIDTIEEWIYQKNSHPQKRRTLLNLRRPFSNHNGVDTLNFSPETGKLILTTGDGGSGFDPFNLAQDDLEIPGKIIEIDINQLTNINNPPVVTRFDELPPSIQKTLTIIGKGGRNLTGISFQSLDNQWIKYVGNVGQELVESVYAFTQYNPVKVTNLVQAYLNNYELNEDVLVNLGWRGWEGHLPTVIINSCVENSDQDKKTIAFYEEVISTALNRLQPLTCYYHQDPRPDKLTGSALTSVKPYRGNQIPDLNGCVVFTDWYRTDENSSPARGGLAYTRFKPEGKLNDYGVIEIDHYQSQPEYYVSLGTNLDQTRLYLGVYASTNVTDLNQGTVYEIVR